jgi:hypothetical protein
VSVQAATAPGAVGALRGADLLATTAHLCGRIGGSADVSTSVQCRFCRNHRNLP